MIWSQKSLFTICWPNYVQNYTPEVTRIHCFEWSERHCVRNCTLSKASFAPKSGNFGNFEYRLYFQIPRETFVALSVWFLLTQYNVTLSKLYFTCQKMIFLFWTVWHFPIWWHMICNMISVTCQICASYALRHDVIYLGVAAGQFFERSLKVKKTKIWLKNRSTILTKNDPSHLLTLIFFLGKVQVIFFHVINHLLILKSYKLPEGNYGRLTTMIFHTAAPS